MTKIEAILESSWRRSLAMAVRTFDELSTILDLPLSALAGSEQRSLAESQFPLLVPRSYIARMRHGDSTDPLLLQVMSRSLEAIPVSGFTNDAVGDLQSRRSSGLLQKYRGRALLMVSGNCAVHCRYCFRRHYPYESEPRRLDDLISALDPIRQDHSVSEVILSGGDPLLISDKKLSGILLAISSIPHVARVRIHTRLPVVLPDRITGDLINLLKETRLRVVFVIHANHANELVADARHAVEMISAAGINVLNQSVLLSGVNDSVNALFDLSERLVACGVMPYYLHLLDRVNGAAHFEVEEKRGVEILAELRKILPGYAVPRLVREEAGEPAKTLVF